MKKVAILVSILSAFATLGVAGTIVVPTQVLSPGSTFLTQSANDNCTYNPHSAGCTSDAFFSPDVIDLQALGINIGDSLAITTSAAGSMCYFSASCSVTGNPVIGGVFSTTSTFLDRAQANRVSGSVASELPSFSTTMYYNIAGTVAGANASNTNPNDFLIPFGSTTNVHVTGRFLFLGIFDSFYADNAGTASVNITATTAAVPEPGTYVLMLAGLGALALRKLRA